MVWWQKWAPWLNISAVFVDIATVAILGTLTPNHDPIHGYISTLGTPGQPFRGWYVLGGTTASVLHLAFVATLLGILPQRRASWVATGLLTSFFVVQWLGAAVWPCEADCGWTTLAGRAHYGLGFSGFFAFGFSMIGLSVAIKGQGWPLRQAIHWTMAIGVAVSLLLLWADLAGQFHGLAERGVLVVFSAWNVLVALSAKRRRAESQSPPGATATS